MLFLVDERGVGYGLAAAALAVLQLGGALARLAAGRRSDLEGLRIPLLRRIAVADAVLLRRVAALATGPGALLYPVLALAGVTAMCWNGLAFTAAAEIAGRRRAGTAVSLQNTIVSVGGAAAPAAFGAVVAATSWSLGFAICVAAPVAAFAVLRAARRRGEREGPRARAPPGAGRCTRRGAGLMPGTAEPAPGGSGWRPSSSATDAAASGAAARSTRISCTPPSSTSCRARPYLAAQLRRLARREADGAGSVPWDAASRARSLEAM